MTATVESIGTARTRRPAIGTLRLRLKPAHQTCGFVQGAWWPRTTELTTELPSLLAALSLRFGQIDAVSYHESDWSPAPLSVQHEGGKVALQADHGSPNVISLFGEQFGRLIVLVVPPYTEPTRAYTVVPTAASANDASTPDQLLGIGMRGAEGRHLAPIALDRWESDGGALYPAPQPQKYMEADEATGSLRSVAQAGFAASAPR